MAEIKNARILGIYEPPIDGGQWGNRAGAAIDSYQANLYGLAEAAGSDWAGRQRQANEEEAAYQREQARRAGAISSYKDVGGLGDFGNYAGGLALDSAPYLGEALLGGITGGATLPGTVARMGLGTLSRGVARTAGAVGASYPSSVGDILANQREQTGTTNLGSALLGGIPYAAANAFGVEGALARGAAMKSGIRALDELTGLRGVAARTGASVGKGVLTEAPAETFQEGVNQYFGRMAVDPNETFFNERSNDRFMESAVGGGVLGGLFGGGMGGWRRSNEWYEKQAEDARRTADAQPQTDLLQGDTPDVPKVGEQGTLFGYGANPNQYDETGRSDPLPAVEELFAAKRGIAAKVAELQRRYDVAEDAFKSTGDYDTWNAQRSQLIGMLAQLSPQADLVEAQIERYTNANRMEMANYGLPTAEQGRLNFDPGVGAPEKLYDYGLPSTVDLAGVINPYDVGGFISRTGTGESIDPTTPQYGLFGGGGGQSLGANLGPALTFTAPEPVLPNVINVNPFGQAGGSEEQNQTLLANVDDPATELMRQRIAQGFTGAPWPPAKGSSKSTTAAAAAAPAAPWANQAESDRLGLPKQPTKAAKQVFDEAVEALKNGDLDKPGYFAVAAELKGGKTLSAKRALKAELNRVAGLKATPAAPTQPTTPNVVINAAGPANQGVVTRSAAPDTKPSAPAAPINEPTNQLLQGTPDVSVADVAGERTGGSSVGQRADTGTGVADAGRNTAAAVGVPAPAGRVEPVGSQAGTVSDAAPGGTTTTVSEDLKKTGKLLDKIKGKTAVVGGSVDFAALKDILEVHDTRMHHAVRLYLGVDKDGHRLDGSLSAQEAAEKAGIAKPGKKNTEVSRIANALGITKAVRNRWTTSNATVNERADGEIEDAPVTGEDAPIGRFQAEYIGEDEASASREISDDSSRGRGGALAATGDNASEDTSDVENEDFAEQGERQTAGGLSSVGGSQGKTEGKMVRLQNRKFYQLVREKGLDALSDEELADVVVNAMRYAQSQNAEDKRALSSIMNAAKDRSKSSRGFERAVAVAYNRVGGLTETKDADKSTAKEKRGKTVDKLQDTSNVIDGTDLEAEVNTKLDGGLTEEDKQTLAVHYSGAPDFTPEVKSKFVEDVLKAINEGIGAVDKAIRSIASKMMAVLLSVGFVFNPNFTSPAEAVVVSHKSYFVEKGISLPEVPPDAAARMSPAAQTAYQQLYAGLKGELQRTNKLLVITDKPTARIFVFKPDGSLLIQDKVLIGKQVGDYYKGNTDVPTNRITPAGLFNMGLRDAARGGGEARTAGEYDFGKVFVLDKAIEGEWSVTLFHSVWTQESDAKQRLNALDNNDANDSRYSFGCINLRKATYKNLLDKYLPQMDGAKLFIVPDNQAAVNEFLSGETAQNKSNKDDLTRQSVPETKPTPDRVVEAETSSEQRVPSSPTPAKDMNYMERRRQAQAAGRTRFGKNKKGFNPDGTAKKPYTAAALIKELADFMRVGSLGRNVVVVDSVEDLLNSTDPDQQQVGRAMKDQGAFGVEAGGKAYLVANRINQGQGRAKFMHEVGSHLGIENLLPQRDFDRLFDKIREWARKEDGSQESELALAATQRAIDANTPAAEARAEVVAYFIEEAVEAGIDPTAGAKLRGPMGEWFRTLWAAFKDAVRKIRGINVDKLTPQDVVNLAYGAARLEVAGTWHGTASMFRRFNSNRMGSGLGAQAFGWGTYLAQVKSEADRFMKLAVRRNTGKLKTDEQTLKRLNDWAAEKLGQDADLPSVEQIAENVVTLGERLPDWAYTSRPEGSLLSVDTAVSDDELLDWDEPIRKQSKLVQDILANDRFTSGLMTTDGQGLYNALEDRAKSLIQELDGKQFEGREDVSAPEVVSKYLDSIGIKGVKYLDYKGPGTHNLVIFNDKNVFRVGAQVAADPQRMRFGTNSAAMSTEAEARAWLNARTQPVATAEKAIRAYPAALRPAARAVHRVLGKYARGALNTVMFTEDLMNRAIDLGMKSAKAYKDLANQKESFTGSYERRVLNTVSGYHDLPESIKGKGPGTVNAFLQDSQMQSEFAGKWGYQPSWLDKVEIDPKAKAAYEALGDKGMAYVDAVFKLGHDTLALKKQTVIESTTSEYDVLIAAAVKDGNTEEADELTAEKAKALEQFGTLMKLGGKFPYSPVKRFGNYVVIAESQKYINAKRAGDTKLMRQLEGDPDEYFVDFAESDGDAQKIEDELRATGLYVDPGYRPRETMRDDLYGGSNTLKALSKLRERAAAMPEATSQDKQTKEAATKLRALLTDLYLMQLAEGSSRKSEMRRRGVAGNIDMIRSLETQGKADAHFLGSVKFGGKMLESIGEMRKEMRDGNRDERLRRSEALNEIIARHLQSMDYKETPLVDALRMVPSVFFLSLSPSYYIQNALQPFMLSLPLMAAKHGYGKTSKALVDAYTSIAPAFKNADVLKQIDFDALLAPSNTALTKDEKVMVQSLLDSGRLDIGMTSEFGSLRADGDGKVSAAWNKARDGLQGLQSKMEALNRLSTALAAFRLESGSGAVKATEYADRVIQETHGNYNAQNAPRAFNTAWGKVGLQFKKYQLIQLTLMAKLLKNSFGEANTKEEKDARTLARKALAYTMGQAAVIGGGKALPIPFVVAWLFGAAFGDDSDEPPEYVLRRMIGNKDIADLLISGPLSFAGINGSGLGGFGTAVAALPFVDVDLTSREGVMETAFAIGAGPLGGLSLKAADAVGAMTNGDYFKGLGMLLPKGPGSLIKAGEQMVNGVYQRDGDITMSADEISAWASLQQGLGFTPQQTLERQFRQQSAYKIDGSMRDQSAEIKRMYSRALKNGESTAEAKDAWMKYQAKRVNMGYERQPMSELTKSAKTQGEREKKTVGGVQYRDSNRQFVETLGSI